MALHKIKKQGGKEVEEEGGGRNEKRQRKQETEATKKGQKEKLGYCTAEESWSARTKVRCKKM